MSTCPVCEGKRKVTGILVPGAFKDDPSGQTLATVYCPNDCHRGTVPTMPAPPDVNTGPLKALRRIATCGTIGDSEMGYWMREEARAAIAAAEQGAAA